MSRVKESHIFDWVMGKDANQIRSNLICTTQNHRLDFISLGVDTLYRFDIICPYTHKPGEEKIKKNSKQEK